MAEKLTTSAQVQVGAGIANLPGRLSGKKQALSAGVPSPRRMLLRIIWRERWVYLMLVPGVIYFLIFYYVPLLGNVAAFQDFSPFLGFFRSPWVGFSNFVSLVSDPDVIAAIKNTLIISVLQIVFAFPAGIILALLLNEIVSMRFKRIMQSILYLPHFLGWVIIISIWQQIFGGDGFLNHLITGMGGKPLDLLTNPNFFKPMILLQVIWKDSGWSTIMFLAAITGIDFSLYEAAVTDGAGRWRRLWHITLPGIRGIIILLLILRLGNVLNVGFEQVYLQQAGLSAAATQVIDTFVYNNGIINGEWGVATAAGLVKALIGVILIYTANRIAKKVGEEGLF
ncbi:MAG TPA: ABC transporter permease subunit [Ktedonobacteraceae bacterium]|nr:ABC transporter permease subunit [Ktedonobacteraceae bacterium]